MGSVFLNPLNLLKAKNEPHRAWFPLLDEDGRPPPESFGELEIELEWVQSLEQKASSHTHGDGVW